MTDAEITLEPEGLEPFVTANSADGKYWVEIKLPTMDQMHRAHSIVLDALSRSTLPREGQGEGWRRDEPPLEKFVLVRPVGIHPAWGTPFVPTVAQRLDWSGERRWYTSGNEIEAINFGEDMDPETVPESMRYRGTEWRFLPDDATLSPSPAVRDGVAREAAIKECVQALTSLPCDALPSHGYGKGYRNALLDGATAIRALSTQEQGNG